MTLAAVYAPLIAIAASVGILLGLAIGLNLYAMPVPSGFGYDPEDDQ